MTFDFERAHRELAKPAFESLPVNIRDLVERVHVECKDIFQGRDLLVPFPSNESGEYQDSLRYVFEKIPAEILAAAAHIVHFYGHWGSKDCFQEHGTYWKFSNYADQVLMKKANLPYSNPERGYSFKIYDGFLRLCFSSMDLWTWEEIGLGTYETLERARKIGDFWIYWDMYNQFELVASGLKKELMPRGGFIEKFFDLSEYGA